MATLAELMLAKRAAGRRQQVAQAMLGEKYDTPLTDEERAALEAEMMATGRPPQAVAPPMMGQPPTPEQRAALWGRRGADVGQTVSPNVFAPTPRPDADLVRLAGGGGGEVLTNDPSAITSVGKTTGHGPEYYATVRAQLTGLANRVGAPPPQFSDNGRYARTGGVYGISVPLSDANEVAAYTSRLMDMQKPAPDVIEGLALKARDADEAKSDYFPFPAQIVQQYGLAGVNLSDLSVGEKLTLRRMGVTLPPPRRARRR